MRITEINLEPYKLSYLLSNSSRQLIASFGKIGSFESFWKSNSSASLLDQYAEVTRNGLSDFDSLIKAYIILIAATKFEYKTALDTLEALNLSILDWGEQIKNHLNKARREMVIITSNARAQIQLPSKSEESTKFTPVIIGGRRVSETKNSSTTDQQTIIER